MSASLAICPQCNESVNPSFRASPEKSACEWPAMSFLQKLREILVFAAYDLIATSASAILLGLFMCLIMGSMDGLVFYSFVIGLVVLLFSVTLNVHKVKSSKERFGAAKSRLSMYM